MRLILALTLTFLGWTGAFSSEIDSFTQRGELLDVPEGNPSNTEILNEVTNGRLAAAIAQANRKSRSCNEKTLFSQVKGFLSGPTVNLRAVGLGVHEGIQGKVEREIDKGWSSYSKHAIPRLTIKRKDAVFGSFPFKDSWGIYSHYGTILRVGNNIIGSDKFGHFFGQGLAYHRIKKKSGLDAALNWGRRMEEGVYGYKMTGIFSHGDLAANYDGMKFWDRLVEEQEGKPAYVKCVDGKWVQNTVFDWGEYITPAWDEAVNCNKFKNENLTQRYYNKIRKLEKKQNRQLMCPVDKDQCQSLEKIYPDKKIREKMISPLCLGEVSTDEDKDKELSCKEK